MRAGGGFAGFEDHDEGVEAGDQAAGRDDGGGVGVGEGEGGWDGVAEVGRGFVVGGFDGGQGEVVDIFGFEGIDLFGRVSWARWGRFGASLR